MIKIEHLAKQYGRIKAVNDISFEIHDGEIVGFLGPNGAGKSTTMNILCGYLSCSAGKAEINGMDILENPLEAKKQIGFLPEQPPLYMDMTVEEYLNFIYDLKDTTLKRDEHLAEICEVTGIAHMRKRLIRNLSKGYKQRVGIAQALIGNPSVLIFDEPTVGLDPKQIVEVRNLIRSLGKKHTVILSTHILSEVQAVCDRIIIIEKEILSAIRSRAGVSSVSCLGKKDLDSSTFVVESQPGIDLRKPLFNLMAANHYPIIGLEAQGLNLEDVFITAVEEEEPVSKKSRKRGR